MVKGKEFSVNDSIIITSGPLKHNIGRIVTGPTVKGANVTYEVLLAGDTSPIEADKSRLKRAPTSVPSHHQQQQHQQPEQSSRPSSRTPAAVPSQQQQQQQEQSSRPSL